MYPQQFLVHTNSSSASIDAGRFWYCLFAFCFVATIFFFGPVFLLTWSVARVNYRKPLLLPRLQAIYASGTKIFEYKSMILEWVPATCGPCSVVVRCSSVPTPFPGGSPRTGNTRRALPTHVVSWAGRRINIKIFCSWSVEALCTAPLDIKIFCSRIVCGRASPSSVYNTACALCCHLSVAWEHKSPAAAGVFPWPVRFGTVFCWWSVSIALCLSRPRHRQSGGRRSLPLHLLIHHTMAGT